jgi:hypothetical protein
MNDELPLASRRRAFLQRSAGGLGGVALASLLNPSMASAGDPNTTATDRPASITQPRAANAGLAGNDRWPGTVHPLHHPPKAKRVIWLTMAGGMSHLDTFDHKPKLAALHGQPMPESMTKGQPIAQLQGQQLRCFAPQFPFRRHGRSGIEISSLFPRLAEHADELCVLRSMVTEAINHDPAHTFMNTGTLISGRPSMGSWAIYGLGADTENLPGFVVLMSTGRGGQMQPIAARQWHSGFLPGRFQGVALRGKGDPVLYLGNPPGVTPERQRDVIDAAATLNRKLDARIDDPEIATRINQYEMAFRLQSSVPELADFRGESKATLAAYGASAPDGSYAANCLMARRLAERGCRFIQLYHRDWDNHNDLKRQIQIVAGEVDQATAALLGDLRQRGMLDDTLVVFGSEFGRTPMAQGNGRDHHQKSFTMWLAGGGVKPGTTWGATDDLGYHSVDKVVHVHDLHATMLHLLGVDHKRLTYRFQGRDFRLTDVFGNVISGVLA